MPPTPSRRLPWSSWSAERLMQLRLRDLGVTIEGTWLQDCVTELYAELEQQHLRLMGRERRELLEVEGGTHAECMKIMRHECGHAVQHGYQLHRRREWQRLFGKSSTKYPESYQIGRASCRERE